MSITNHNTPGTGNPASEASEKQPLHRFKTNINCAGCVAAVKPFLDEVAGPGKWAVDTANKDKILSVQPGGITEEKIIETVKRAGYKIETVNH